MKHSSIAPPLSAQDRLGRRLAARLDQSTDSLPHDVTERLRAARMQAMAQFRPAALPAAVSQLNAGTAALTGNDDEGGLWPRLVALVPLLALAAGLFVIQILGDDHRTRELAEIDAAILTDDLPPAAYTDPGFAQFLRARLEQTP